MKRALVIMITLLAWGCGGDEPSTKSSGPASSDDREEKVAEALADPVFIQACAETPGCSEPPRFDAPAAAEAIWRVYIVREPSGTVRIERIDSVRVPEGDGVPIGPLSGSHFLVGLDRNDDPVDGQRIRFPVVANIEFDDNRLSPEDADSDGAGSDDYFRPAREEIDLSDQTVDTIAYLRARPSIDTIAIKDETGSTIAETPAPVETALVLSGVRPSQAGVAFAQSSQQPIWPYLGNVPPYCSHVIILEGEADRELARGIAFEDLIQELVVPGPNQRAVIFGALRRMTPLLCQSIGRIALGTIPTKPNTAGAVLQVGTGDMMILNVLGRYSERELANGLYFRLKMMRTITHEAGHSAEALLHVQGGDPPGDFSGDWILPARTLASRTVDNVRIEKGFRDEWLRVHESFEALAWAQDHQTGAEAKEAVYGWSPQQVSDGGFMSWYGSTSLWDDIAEMIAWTYLTGPYLEAGWGDQWKQDFACREMRRYRNRDLPSRLVTVYTKLMFLKDLGLVAEEDVETCMGPDIGLPIRSAGFHFWHDGNMLRSFDNNLTAKIGTTNDGTWVFEMEAEGEASFSQEMYPAKIELRIGLEEAGVPMNLVAWPRGVYKLGLFENHTLRLRLKGKPAGDFDVKDGYVLVAEASKDRIAGSIFITVAMRFGAPLPVPQTWKPPLIIRFMIDK